MGQFRTSADILDLALQKAGEVTNGNSPYETQALNYLNRVHFALVTGGTIPLGKDATVEIDESWIWSRAKHPILLELQPKVDTGSITLTQGSEAGTFSSAPAASLEGWHISVEGRDEWFKIAQHTAASTAFELDGAYPDASGSGLQFKAVKLDYRVIPDFLIVDSSNNKFDFKKAAGGSLLIATLTPGVYSPAALATHVASVVTTAAAGPTITGSYSSVTRKFTFVSDGAAASVFQLFFGSGTNVGQSASGLLGYDTEDLTGALTYTSGYALGAVARLIETFHKNKGASREGNVYGTDPETFQRDYPLPHVCEGYPSRFSVIGEDPDGTLTVRFNKYAGEKTRIEVEHVPVPRDLKDNVGSVPLVPRKHIDILEDACTFYIMLDKSDDRADLYANLIQGKLKAMISQHRGSLEKSGTNFGECIPRLDLTDMGRRRLFPEDPY